MEDYEKINCLKKAHGRAEKMHKELSTGHVLYTKTSLEIASAIQYQW